MSNKITTKYLESIGFKNSHKKGDTKYTKQGIDVFFKNNIYFVSYKDKKLSFESIGLRNIKDLKKQIEYINKRRQW